MSVIVWGNAETTPLFEQWAVKRMPHMDPAVGVGPCKAAVVATGNTNADKILAVILFHAADPQHKTAQVSISAASPRWATRDNIRQILGAAFDGWKYRKLWSVVASDNERAQKLCAGLGFKLEARMRHQYGHKIHAFCYGMMDSEFRAIWSAPRLVSSPHGKIIGARHGQEIRAIAA